MPTGGKKRAAFKLGSIEDGEDTASFSETQLDNQDDAFIDEDEEHVTEEATQFNKTISTRKPKVKRAKDVHLVHSKLIHAAHHRHHQRAPSGSKIILVNGEEGVQVMTNLPRTRSATSIVKPRLKGLRNVSESQLSKYHIRQPPIMDDIVDKSSREKAESSINHVDKLIESPHLMGNTSELKKDTILKGKIPDDKKIEIVNTFEEINDKSLKRQKELSSPPKNLPEPIPPKMFSTQIAPPQVTKDSVESIQQHQQSPLASSIRSISRPPSLLSLTSITSDGRPSSRVHRIGSGVGSSVAPQLTQTCAISRDLSPNRSISSNFVDTGTSHSHSHTRSVSSATTLLRHQQNGRVSSLRSSYRTALVPSQRKVLLQRPVPDVTVSSLEEYEIDTDKVDLEIQSRLIREIERVSREFSGIQSYRDPMYESLSRCFVPIGRQVKKGVK